MNRTECQVDVRNLSAGGSGEETQPRLTIEVAIISETFSHHLEGGDGEQLSAGEIDVTYRLQTGNNEKPGTGVLAITDSITGAYVLEALLDPPAVDRFVTACKYYADLTGDPPYTVQIACQDGKAFTFEKRVFLVFDNTGTLLRDKSLIPNDIHV